MEEIQQVQVEIDEIDEIQQEPVEIADIDDTTEELQAFINKRLDALPRILNLRHNAFLPCVGEKTIFRFPDHDRELCEPRVVSIGPYHHGRVSLRTMETYKWHTLRTFLDKGEDHLKFYLNALKSIETQTRQCYSEPVDMTSDEFVMMMLLDGCFILQWINSFNSHRDLTSQHLDIFYDLCLIENQLPFFVIKSLWTILCQGSTPDMSHTDESHLVHIFNTVFEECSTIWSIKFNPIVEINDDSIWHLLHLYYMGVTSEFERHPQTNKQSKWTPRRPVLKSMVIAIWSLLSRSADKTTLNVDITGAKDIHITCVSELCDAGIKFKKKKMPIHMLDITFENGTIEMPFLQIESRFVRMLWNMVALEQVGTEWDSLKPLSSYLALMDALIDTDKDIPILERAGIVDNYFSNADEAAYFFNQFGKAFRLNYRFHYFYGLFKTVRERSESTWPKYRARLMQDYFSSPWAIISVLAAGALFGLTILQTYYAAKSIK